MLTKDRDRLLELFVFYDFLDNWVNDEESELKIKDVNKLKIIKDNVLALMVQYRKQEGIEALETILEESKKYKFAMIPKDEDLDLTNTFEPDILKNAMRKVVNSCTQCTLCNIKDYKKCEWFTINNFLDIEKTNKNKKDCPFKNDINNIFDFDENI